MVSSESLSGTPGLASLDALAASALEAWAIEADAPRLINLSENATYRIDDPYGRPRFALRIHREGYHSHAAILSELAWLRALRTDGIVTTPVPVAGRNGDLIQAVRIPDSGRTRRVVLFEWETGTAPSETDDLTGKFAVLGATAARMHLHSREWQRPAGFERLTWDFDTSIGERPHWGRWRDGIGVGAAEARLFARTAALIGRRLARFGKGPERFGLVHCDMRLANLLVDGDAVKVLDFDDCGFGWRLYDAATAVSFFEDAPHVPELMAAWVQGYRRVADLPAEDAAEIPTFIMLRRLLLVAWIGSHAETDLARSLGADYTAGTAPLCEAYLARAG